MSGTRKNPGRLVLGPDEFKPSVLVITAWDARGRPRLAQFIYPDEPDAPIEGTPFHIAYMIGRTMRKSRGRS